MNKLYTSLFTKYIQFCPRYDSSSNVTVEGSSDELTIYTLHTMCVPGITIIILNKSHYLMGLFRFPCHCDCEGNDTGNAEIALQVCKWVGYNYFVTHWRRRLVENMRGSIVY